MLPISDIQRKICESSKEYAEQHVGDLLGLIKVFMTCGLRMGVQDSAPKPLAMSQQSLFEPSDLVIKKGGKTVKKRKHRNTNKSANAKKILDDDALEQAGPGALYNGSRVNWDYVPTIGLASASDFSQSDTEGASGVRHEHRSKQSQLRLSCMLLMERLSKAVDRKTMFGYWNYFVPQQFAPESVEGAAVNKPIAMLPNLLLVDPSPKCRCMIAQTLSTFVRLSKFFLYQAESDSRVSSSFTAFSVSMGQSIIATYRILTKALSGESHVAVIIQLLKCFSSLIQATPFHKLETGMVTNLVKYIRKLVHHKDLDVKVSSLVIIGFLLAVPEKTKEIREQLGLSLVGQDRNKMVHAKDEERAEEDYDVEREWEEQEEAEGESIVDDRVAVDVERLPEQPPNPLMSWILRVVLDLLGVKVSDYKSAALRVTPPTPLKVECLHILLAVTSHPELLRGNLRYFTDAAQVALDDPSPECHLFAVRVIDYTGYALSHCLATGPGTGPGLDECIEFWDTVLPLIADQLQKASCQKYFVKPICCDALSNVGCTVFEKLPHHKRAFIIALLQGCFYDGDVYDQLEGEQTEGTLNGNRNLVKASAGRALSVYALFPSLREDLAFIETTSEMIVGLFQDKNAIVRKKCTWSLGNILEALVDMQSTAEANVNGTSVQDQYLESFFVACLTTGDDHEKVRSNIMRCLGNLVRLLTAQHMREEKWRRMAMQSVQAVVDNALHFKVVKVKWNACYSLGLMMRNDQMFGVGIGEAPTVAAAGSEWPKMVFPALCKLMRESSNFKVRTAAVIAVAVPKERRLYGTHFEGIWEALVIALEQAGNLIDFNEYKHRDNLLDQLCTSVSHFVVLAEERDLVPMKVALMPLFDVTKQNWFRVVNRILPEQGANLISASNKLRELTKGGRRLSPDVREAVMTMANCFAPPLEYE